MTQETPQHLKTDPTVLFEQREDYSNKESFIPLDSVRKMILAGISDRIDENGVVKKVGVDLFLNYNAATGEKYLRGPRIATESLDGPLVPSQEEITDNKGNVILYDPDRYSINSILYTQLLTDQWQTDISAEDISKLALSRQTIDSAAKACGYTTELYRNQHVDSLRLNERPAKAEPDIAPTRIYIPGGTQGMDIVAELLKRGARPSFSKIWIPTETGIQTMRSDTPIIECNTLAEFSKATNTLRQMYAEKFFTTTSTENIIGLPIADIPGAYVGQIRPHSSFNGEMGELFGDAITTACQESPLYTGQTVSPTWFQTVASRTLELSISQAKKRGIDDSCHALLFGQPAQEIQKIVAGE